MDAVTSTVRQDQSQELFFTFRSDGLPDADLKVREFTFTDKMFAPFRLEVALVSERVDLTWRGWCAICPQFFKIDLFAARLGDTMLDNLVRSGEDGLVEA